MTIKNKTFYSVALLLLFSVLSCEDFEKFELPEAGSVEDKTPPIAKFTFQQEVGPGEVWKNFKFSNQSTSAISYSWDFGDAGATSTETEPKYTFSGEGTYTVALVATDGLGVSNTLTQEIVVEEPEIPSVADPILVNTDFTKQPKSSGSDCACSGWINRSLGSQGESTSGNGGTNNLLKFDEDEPDAIYQEFEVTPNADYKIKIVVGFDPLKNGSFPSILETRVLAGTGYVSGYTPTYFATPAEYPQDNFGYVTVAQAEDPNNTLMVRTINHPDDNSYLTYDYQFNSGANTSVAIYMRGIGGDDTSADKTKNFEGIFNNGDEEIQVDSIEIKAVN